MDVKTSYANHEITHTWFTSVRNSLNKQRMKTRFSSYWIRPQKQLNNYCHNFLILKRLNRRLLCYWYVYICMHASMSTSHLKVIVGCPTILSQCCKPKAVQSARAGTARSSNSSRTKITNIDADLKLLCVYLLFSIILDAN